MRGQVDAEIFAMQNSYSFKRRILSLEYENAMTIDSTMPVADDTNGKNWLDKNVKPKKVRTIKSDIPKMDNEFFSKTNA